MSYPIFIDSSEMAGVFDQEIGGAQEVELVVAEVGAASKGRPPKKVRGTVVAVDMQAAEVFNITNGGTGTIALKPGRRAKYLGVAFQVSKDEILRLSAADRNGDDILIRKLNSTVSGDITASDGALMEGGDSPQTYFLYLDRDKKERIELDNSDAINVTLNNEGGAAAKFPACLVNVVPPGARILN